MAAIDISGDGLTSDGKVAGKDRFPGVHFRDDDPKRGFTILRLSIPNLKVKKAPFKEAQANATIDVKFDTGLIEVRVMLNDEATPYVYIKSLPADILPLRSKYSVKNECIKLSLAKKNQLESWASHSRHFTQRSSAVASSPSPNKSP